MRKPSTATRLAAFAMTLGAGSAASAALPSGISGAWYNPEQSGHGLSVKILTPDRALIFWYTYDAEGNPFNLYIDGRVEGRTVRATALAPRGMRFGSFDPADLQMPEWGSITVHFDDCGSGRLDWQANDPAFGSGGFPIQRLSANFAQPCELGDPAAIASGLYEVDIVRSQFGTARSGSGIAAVDPDGRLWALERLAGSPDQVPGPTFVGVAPQVLRATLKQAPDSDRASVARPSLNSWGWIPSSSSAPLAADWRSAGAGGELDFNVSATESQRWTLTPHAATLVQPLDAGRLAGDYQLSLRGQFFSTPARVSLAADGSACISVGPPAESGCRYSGRYWMADAAAGFLDFELTDSTAPAASYRGKGWLQIDAEGEALVLVGDNDHTALALIAR